MRSDDPGRGAALDRLSTHLLAALAEAVVVFDVHGNTTRWNDSARELFGIDESAFRSRPAGSPDWGWLDATGALLRPEDDPVRRTLESGQPITGLRLAIDVHGEVHPVSVNTHCVPIDGSRDVILAVTDLRDRASIDPDIGTRALLDPLTGLPNRTLLLDRLGQALAHAGRDDEVVAAVFMDLDHFKQINDDLGHDAGDRLLSVVADRLTRSTRPADTVARIGGDEFVIIYSGVLDEDSLGHLVTRVQASLQEPVEVRGPMGMADVHPTASLGIAVARGAEGLHPMDLLRRADVAMYEAKAAGRNRVRWFDDELRASTTRRLHLESDLVTAAALQQFVLHYQPVFELGTGAFRGVEALIRWNHPTRGVLLPAEFLTLAEQVGLIIPVGRWVIRTALEQKAAWDTGLDHPVHLAVNLSARQIGHGVAEEVERCVEATGIDPTTVTLELTESLLLEPPARVRDDLAALRAMGTRIALDDFGTGFSPLTHLNTVPIHELKIDRSLVTGATGDSRRTAIVHAVIELGTALGLDTVAEGVESREDADLMLALGARFAQGWYYGPALSAAEMTRRLSAGPLRPPQPSA